MPTEATSRRVATRGSRPAFVRASKASTAPWPRVCGEQQPLTRASTSQPWLLRNRRRNPSPVPTLTISATRLATRTVVVSARAGLAWRGTGFRSARPTGDGPGARRPEDAHWHWARLLCCLDADHRQQWSWHVGCCSLLIGWAQQPWPCQVCRPSLMARAAMASATAGSIHQSPSAALSARLASTPAAR